MKAQLRFSPGIDAETLVADFRRHRRLHIPSVFPPQDAQRIGEALAGPVPWSWVFNLGDKTYDLGAAAIAAMLPARRAELDVAIQTGAREGFQYSFDSWRVSDHLEAGRRAGGPVSPIEAVYDFLNSAPFLDFVSALSGASNAVYCDAQATRYLPGHFLTAHDDDVRGKDRVLAYVLNFTPQWAVDWGGLLVFEGADGHVSGGYVPTFNALNIFSVPQRHAVTQVATFAAAERLSITGWIRSARP